MIGINSVFRRLPDRLEDLQARFLDGIRFNIETADLAFERLCGTCAGLTNHADMDAGTKAKHVVSALSDAWVIIDTTHRLSKLLRNLPGVERRDNWPQLRFFHDCAAETKPLRNAVQHLEGHIRKSADEKFPIWGTLGWLSTNDGTSFTSWLLLPGRMTAGSRPYVNPTKRVPRLKSGIAEPTLAIEKGSVCLTDVIESIERVAQVLEAALEESFSRDIPKWEPEEVDMLICMNFDLPREPDLPE